VVPLPAGLQPTDVHPLTRQVLTEVGIDPSGLRAKGVQEFMGRVTVRHAIVVCEETEPACPRVFLVRHRDAALAVRRPGAG
jgi:arsenate reductase